MNLNININIGAGPQLAQGQVHWPSWSVKRGWSIINVDKKQFVHFEMPQQVKYQTVHQLINGQLQAVQQAVPVWGEGRLDVRDITSMSHDYGEVVWPLSEPVLLPLAEVARHIQQNIVALSSGRDTAGGSEGTKLHKLPYDIQLQIFNSIDNVADAMKLCLAHPTLLQVGYKRVAELANARWAPCAGDRLLALPGKQDRQFWNGVRTQGPPNALSSDSDLMADIEAAGGFVPYLNTYQPAPRRGSCPYTISDLTRQMPQFKWSASPSINLCHHPRDADYVVCNVTKREYVRAAPGTEPIGLWSSSRRAESGTIAQVLPSRVGPTIPARICCGSENTGPWAGDRIVVRPLEKARVGFKDWARWTDVTNGDDPVNRWNT